MAQRIQNNKTLIQSYTINIYNKLCTYKAIQSGKLYSVAEFNLDRPRPHLLQSKIHIERLQR